MSEYSYDHPFGEVGNAELIAHIEYSVEPASGDGWNEPRESAWPEIERVTVSLVWSERGAPARTTQHGEWPGLIDALSSDDDLMSALLEYAGEDA